MADNFVTALNKNENKYDLLLALYVAFNFLHINYTRTVVLGVVLVMSYVTKTGHEHVFNLSKLVFDINKFYKVSKCSFFKFH